MALIQLNGIISNIKGSIGGVTFSNVKNGIALKRKLVGKKSINTYQLGALNTNLRGANVWRDLSFGQKNNWNLFSSAYTFTDRYGVTSSLSGYNWCLLVNALRASLGASVATSPPSYILPDILPTIYLTMTSTTMVLSWALPIDPSTVDLMIYASLPTRGQAVLNKSNYRLINKGSADYTNSIDITDAWENMSGLNYEDAVDGGNFNINILVVPVSKSSYISGVGQTTTSQKPLIGIGAMAIGSTFIVS